MNIKTSVIPIAGLICNVDAKIISLNVGMLPGIKEVNINFESEKLLVAFDHSQINEREIIDSVRNIGYGVSTCTIELRVTGMKRLADAFKLEKGLINHQGVLSANVGFVTGHISLEYLFGITSISELTSVIQKAGFDVILLDDFRKVEELDTKLHAADLKLINKLLQEEIIERKKAENKIIIANRIYAVISRINQSIVRTRDRDNLLREVCQIAVDYGKFRMAWIGLKDEETKTVIPLTFSGFEEGYLTAINAISFDDIPTGKGPTGRAIREGVPIVCDDFENNPLLAPWKDEALKHGFRSSIAVPIKLYGKVIGAFMLYASIPHFFDKEETDLLVEVSSNISFAIDSIETEKKKKEAEQEIQQLNETLEKRVEQRTAQLEAANKEMEAFSYSISHDLRAPLRHINGFISLFLENKKTDLTEEELGYLNVVSHAANEMGDLIDALLSFSRLNRAEIQKTQINPKPMISQLLEMFTEEFKSRKIEIKINELPLIHGDYQLIRQVWMNLLSNAIKYTSKKEFATIEIGSFMSDSETVFYVKDNGAGFNMKYGNKLFGVFQRLHKPRDFEGIGIGLANVNRIITRHGGRCWAEGEIDQGATFYFSLPKSDGSGYS